MDGCVLLYFLVFITAALCSKIILTATNAKIVLNVLIHKTLKTHKIYGIVTIVIIVVNVNFVLIAPTV